MQLINAIVSTPDDLDFRLHLRNEFMRSGLIDALEVRASLFFSSSLCSLVFAWHFPSNIYGKYDCNSWVCRVCFFSKKLFVLSKRGGWYAWKLKKGRQWTCVSFSGSGEERTRTASNSSRSFPQSQRRRRRRTQSQIRQHSIRPRVSTNTWPHSFLIGVASCDVLLWFLF